MVFSDQWKWYRDNPRLLIGEDYFYYFGGVLSMRMSQLYMPTLKEVPKDAEIISQQLLMRAGFIRQTAAGIYSYLPLCYRVMLKIESVVREEMNRAGGQEILMSALQPQEIWEQSGRWNTYGPEIFRLTNRSGRGFCLGPTAEEYYTTLINGEVNSYKQLPLCLYQIQTKFRDEKRPRYGLYRCREFLMKDAYTFDASPEGMQEAYENMKRAYIKIFDRLQVDYRIVLGDSFSMGGSKSEEFLALSSTGEGLICYAEDYSANDETAPVHLNYHEQGQQSETQEKVYTPDCKTIDDVAQYTQVDPAHCLKAIDLNLGKEKAIVFIPGDRELNMAKLIAYTKVPEHEISMMESDEIIGLGSYPGFTGPLDLDKDKVRIIIDRSVTTMKNLLVGANEKDYHIKNVNFGIDFDGEIAEDLLMVKEGDICPLNNVAYQFCRGIEVGHIFQLGTKYSESLNTNFLDANGKSKPFWMGSYGIGISRLITTLVDQNNDEHGIIWPICVAPYQVVITIVNIKDENQKALAEKMYEELLSKNIEVLLDDRKERPGVKFNDRDLVGIPIRITVGKKASEEVVEFSLRKDMENTELRSEEALDQVYNVLEQHQYKTI